MSVEQSLDVDVDLDADENVARATVTTELAIGWLLDVEVLEEGST